MVSEGILGQMQKKNWDLLSGGLAKFGNGMLDNEAAKKTMQDSLLGKFDNFMSSDSFTAGLGAIGSGLQIYNAIQGTKAAKKALNMQKEGLEMQKQQLALENERYNKRENERIDANNTIGASAAAFNKKDEDKQNTQNTQEKELMPTERM